MGAFGTRVMRGMAMLALVLVAGCYDPAGVARRGAGGPGLEVFRTLRIEAGTHTDTITAMAADRSERLLLTASRDKTARLWSMADGRPGPVLRPPIAEGDIGRLDAAALAPDGRLAAVGGRSAGATRNAVLLFDTGDGRLVTRIERPNAPADDAVGRLGFSPDGRLVGATYRDGVTVWYSVPDGQAISTGPLAGQLPPPPAAVLPLGNGGRVVVGDERRLTRRGGDGGAVWDVGPAVPRVSRLDLSANGGVVRINFAGGSQVFSVEDMDDDVQGGVRFTNGPPAGQMARLADGSAVGENGGAVGENGSAVGENGSAVGEDGSALVRRARDGTRLWSTKLDARITAVAASSDGAIVVAALGDGTLRWFGAGDGRERLALFFHPASDGWVTWTPSGFFDHSDNAWNYAGWHVNRGPGRAAEFVTIDQLYDVAYRPDLVRLAVTGIEQDVAALRTGEAASSIAVLERGLPPSVTATVTPSADRRHAEVRASVVERGAGIGKVFYRLNGILVALDRATETVAPDSGQTVALARTIPLRSGPNQIEISALDADNQVESVPAEGRVTGGQGDGARGGLKALVVGIDRYQDEAMRLNFAASDARAIAAALGRQPAEVFAGNEVIRLLDAEATTNGIAAAIRRLAGSMTETDTFVLYLAGHGVNLNGEYQFITHDVRRPTEAEVRQRALSQDRIQELLAGVPADRAIIVLDTCFSGGVAELYDRNILMRTAHRRLARATGRGFLSAATSAQVAAEGFKGHGVLTAVLLDGLAGAAASGGPEVSARALGRYAGRTVPVIARREFQVEQKPVFSLVGRDFALSRRGSTR